MGALPAAPVSQNARIKFEGVMEVQSFLTAARRRLQCPSLSKHAIDYLISNRKLAVRRIGSRALVPFSELRRFASGDHPGIGDGGGGLSSMINWIWKPGTGPMRCSRNLRTA